MNSAPVFCSVSAARRARGPPRRSALLGVPASAEIVATPARTSASAATVRAIESAEVSASARSCCTPIHTNTPVQIATTAITHASCSSSICVENRTVASLRRIERNAQNSRYAQYVHQREIPDPASPPRLASCERHLPPQVTAERHQPHSAALFRQRSRCARHPRIHHDPDLHGAHHDQA